MGRNEKNETVVDIEINFNKDNYDLRSAVIIEQYSKLLLQNLDRSEEVIKDFVQISKLRGWFWEVYMVTNKQPSYQDCIGKMKKILMALANKYKLNYIED